MSKRTIKIGIDVDGVLRAFGEQFAKYAKKRYDITLKPDDFKDFGFSSVTYDGRKIITDVWANPVVGRFILQQAPRIENALTGYRQFINDSKFDVYIVSSQKKDYEKFTEQWLIENEFTDHIKAFYERNKLNAPVQILIDDKPEHIRKYYSNARDGILINRPHNRDKVDVNYLRADDLIDAYKILKRKY